MKTDEEKSNLQKVIELLETNGFHVFKAVEEAFGMYETSTTGAMQLRIAPKEEVQKC